MSTKPDQVQLAWLEASNCPKGFSASLGVIRSVLAAPQRSERLDVQVMSGHDDIAIHPWTVFVGNSSPIEQCRLVLVSSGGIAVRIRAIRATELLLFAAHMPFSFSFDNHHVRIWTVLMLISTSWA
jgi:hypothetical protein